MPFFIPDLSAWEGPLPNFAAIAAQPNMAGCIIKASQGLGPGVSVAHGHSPQWFALNWPRARLAGGSRYGQSWFRGCYAYGTPAHSGASQADYLLDTVDHAGGWGAGDMPPAWDLEGAEWSARQQIVDVSSQFADRVKQRLGKTPILYTGSVWRKFGIKEKAGFTRLWTTHLNVMEPYGWPNSSVVLHQYAGDGKYYNPATAMFGYPTEVPGLDAKVDMNVVMDGGAPAISIERVRAVLTGRVSRGAGLRVPLTIGIGTGILLVGAMFASLTREDLL